EALPFADNHFNAVISTSALHFCRRPADALKEMQRVLRPGGRMLITDWCDDYWTCKVCNVFLRIWSPAHYRTYTSRKFRELLLEASFVDVTIDRYKIDWLWGLMTARARKP